MSQLGVQLSLRINPSNLSKRGSTTTYQSVYIHPLGKVNNVRFQCPSQINLPKGVESQPNTYFTCEGLELKADTKSKMTLRFNINSSAIIED